jgi:hypothetical protein
MRNSTQHVVLPLEDVRARQNAVRKSLFWSRFGRSFITHNTSRGRVGNDLGETVPNRARNFRNVFYCI